MASATYDLHGIKGQPFPSFGEEWSYLERVTVRTPKAARTILAAESGMNPDEHDPRPIFMRWLADGNDAILQKVAVEDVPCWYECAADHPDAVPFWKDVP